MQHSLYFEAKDWDRVGRNELIGAKSIPVKDIIEQKGMESWFKLLEQSVGRSKYFKIFVEQEVSEDLIKEATRDDRKTIRRKKKIIQEDVPTNDVPKLKIDDFELISVLGKGSFGKVSILKSVIELGL